MQSCPPSDNSDGEATLHGFTYRYRVGDEAANVAARGREEISPSRGRHSATQSLWGTVFSAAGKKRLVKQGNRKGDVYNCLHLKELLHLPGAQTCVLGLAGETDQRACSGVAYISVLLFQPSPACVKDDLRIYKGMEGRTCTAPNFL